MRDYTRSLPSLWTHTLEILRPIPVARIAEATGLRRHTVAAVLVGSPPRDSTRKALERYAIEHATERLLDLELKPPHRPESLLALYLHEHGAAICPACGAPLVSARASYCSRACKQSAYRSRASTAA